MEKIRLTKFVTFIFATIFFSFFSCTEEKITDDQIWGIPYSDEKSTTEASGQIVNQNNETINQDLIAYQVTSAFLKADESDLYLLKFNFITKDSLLIFLSKQTHDINFHSDASPGQNKLMYSLFNKDTLEMDPSAVAINPSQEYSGFETVVNLHTVQTGDYNGTVSQVPLLE